MRRFFSRFSPRYVRSLVYMLQASEYNVHDYLVWLGRVQDFRTVERRKHLVLTPKAAALLGFGWILVITAVGIIAWDIGAGEGIPRAAAVAFAILFPFALPYLLALAAIFMRVVQWPVERYLVARARRVLARHRAVKIAVAGSYGKTSMRETLRTVLAEGRKVAAPPGSYNTPLGIVSFTRTLRGDEEVLIFELGEYYSGDVRTLCEFVQPEMGIITGVNEAHLERFGTLAKTAATIFELADYLGEKPVYVNDENETARAHARAGHVLFSRAGAGEWRVEHPATGLDGTSFTLVRGNDRIEAHSKLLGLHMIGSLAAAAHIADRLGFSRAQIECGIAKTEPFEHRLELKCSEGGVITLDDSYNGNPDGVAAVIDFLASLKGRRWYVTPGLVEMGARKREIHRDIGKTLARAGIEKVILIRNSVTPFIEAGLNESCYAGEIVWFDDALAAYAALPQMTVAGDIVLLQNDWPDQYA